MSVIDFDNDSVIINTYHDNSRKKDNIFKQVNRLFLLVELAGKIVAKAFEKGFKAKLNGFYEVYYSYVTVETSC